MISDSVIYPSPIIERICQYRVQRLSLNVLIIENKGEENNGNNEVENDAIRCWSKTRTDIMDMPRNYLIPEFEIKSFKTSNIGRSSCRHHLKFGDFEKYFLSSDLENTQF